MPTNKLLDLVYELDPFYKNQAGELVNKYGRAQAPSKTVSPERKELQREIEQSKASFSTDLVGHLKGATLSVPKVAESVGVQFADLLQFLGSVSNDLNPTLALLPQHVQESLRSKPEEVKKLVPEFIAQQMMPPPPGGFINDSKYFLDQKLWQPLEQAWLKAKLDVNYQPSFENPEDILRGKKTGNSADVLASMLGRASGLTGFFEALRGEGMTPEERGEGLFVNALVLMGSKALVSSVAKTAGRASLLSEESLRRAAISGEGPITTVSGGNATTAKAKALKQGFKQKTDSFVGPKLPEGSRADRLGPVSVDQAILDKAAKLFPDADTLETAVVQRLGPDLIKKLEALPNEWSKRQINERLAQALRLDEPIKGEIIREARANNISIDEATNMYIAGSKVLADAVEVSARNFGETGKFLSDIAEMEKVHRLVSKNPKIKAADTLATLDGMTMMQFGMQFLRASAVSQLPTAVRNAVSQGFRGFVQATEHAMANTIVALNEGIKRPENRLAYFKRVNDPNKLDFSKIYADTIGDITTMADVAAAPVSTLLKRYGSKAINQLPPHLRNTTLAKNAADTFDEIGTGASAGYRIPLQKMMEEAPIQMLEALGGPISGDLALGAIQDGFLARAKQAKTIQGIIGEEFNAGDRSLSSSVKASVKNFGDTFSTLITSLNRAVEMEQRRWFIAARMKSHLLRNGEEGNLDLVPDMLAKPVDERPPWVDDAVRDSVTYSLRSTFAGNLNKTAKSRDAQIAKLPADLRNALREKNLNVQGQRVAGRGESFVSTTLDLMQRYPETMLILPEFPRFVVNKYMFLTERNPTMLLDFLSPSALDRLSGKIDNDQLNLMARHRKINVGTPEFDTLRSQMGAAAAIQASDQLAKATSGMAMFISAFALRNSKFAGARWNQVDIGYRPDDKETIDYLSLKNYDPFATIVALAELTNAGIEGRNPGEVLSVSEALDMVAGVRSLENTGLKFADVFREFNPNGDVMGQFKDISLKLAGTKLGMLSTFMRTTKDIATVTDLRIPGVLKGTDEGKFLAVDRTPLFDPFLSNLPTGLLETFGADVAEHYAVDPRTGRSTVSPNPGDRFFAGLTTERRTKLDQVFDAMAENPNFVAQGRTTNKNTRELLQKWWGSIIREPLEPGSSRTYGEALADAIESIPDNLGSEFKREYIEAIAMSKLNAPVGRTGVGQNRRNVSLLEFLITGGAIAYDDPSMIAEVAERKGNTVQKFLYDRASEAIIQKADELRLRRQQQFQQEGP